VLTKWLHACRSDDLAQLRLNTLATSTWHAQPVDMLLLHVAQQGGKTNSAGGAHAEHLSGGHLSDLPAVMLALRLA
jgi:hypothetical protein